MAFPGVCAIAVIGIETADAIKTVNAMAKVENVVCGKRRMVRTFLNDRATIYPNVPGKASLDRAYL
jgi:hypothetical protein